MFIIIVKPNKINNQRKLKKKLRKILRQSQPNF